MKKILILFLFSCIKLAYAQQTETFKLKKYKIGELSDSLRESSGLTFFNQKLYSINDSGSPSEIFELEKSSGKITRILKTKLSNSDWEAISSDENHLYIGDIGNNAGVRQALRIYKIPMKDGQMQDSIKTLSYYYPEQKDFVFLNQKNDFDAEAMMVKDKEIHLFTKEWKSKKVTHYTISSEDLSNQAAKKTETFDTGFYVTDAAYFNQKLYLVGYTKRAEVYMLVCSESQSGEFFKTIPRKFYLGSALSLGQIEGVTVNSEGIHISGEAFDTSISHARQSLYFIPMKDFK